MADESWATARSIAASQDWLLTAGQARRAGLLASQVSSELRAGRWRALLHGVYLVDADMATDLPEPVWWRAALLAHGPSACLAGPTAARAHGAQGLPESDGWIGLAVIDGPPRAVRENTVPGQPIDAPLVVVHQWPVQEDEVVTVGGLRARAAQLSVVDAALLLDRVHALCLFDWSLHAGVHTPDSLAQTVAAAARRPGVVHVRAARLLADGRAASPLETRVRLACIDGRVPPDELQFRVLDRWGRLVAVGDLAWVARRARPLIAEADGASVHQLPAAVLHDRRRTNGLVIEACDVVRFTWGDAVRPTYVQQVVRAALAA